MCPQHRVEELSKDDGPGNFSAFLNNRCRAYNVSDDQMATPMVGKETFGCNCYSSGEAFYLEDELVPSWKNMLEWFTMISADPKYLEPSIVIIEQEATEDAVWVDEHTEE